MPRNTISSKDHQEELEALNQGNQKNVSFYFSPEQIAGHNAFKEHETKLASFDEAFELESSSDESEVSGLFSDDESETSSIFSDDSRDQDWSNLAVYGQKLADALTQRHNDLDMNIARQRHAMKFADVKESIKQRGENKGFGIQIFSPKTTHGAEDQQRQALYHMRFKLNKELNFLNNTLLAFIYDHRNTATGTTQENAFFDEVASRRIENAIYKMHARLDKVVPTPLFQTSNQKVGQQLNNIADAILTIKGALLCEMENIADIHNTQTKVLNHALVHIINTTGPEERELAIAKYNDFKSEHNLAPKTVNSEAIQTIRAQLYNRRANLNEYLKDLQSKVNTFIETQQNSENADKPDNVFFNTAIANRIKNTMQSVQNKLDKTVPANNLSIENKLCQQISNIARGVLTIKGALLVEMGGFAEMLVTTDETTKDFTGVIVEMEPDEATLALGLYDQFKLDATLNESINRMSTVKSTSTEALHKERTLLAAELKSFQNELTKLPEQYEVQKREDAANNFNRFFGTGQKPEGHRMEAIERIQATAAQVQDKLNQIRPEYADMTAEEKLKSKINDLKNGIQAIKGSVLNEFTSIQGTVFASERSALHKILDKNYDLSNVKPYEKAQALKAFEALEKPEQEVEQTASLSA